MTSADIEAAVLAIVQEFCGDDIADIGLDTEIGDLEDSLGKVELATEIEEGLEHHHGWCIRFVAEDDEAIAQPGYAVGDLCKLVEAKVRAAGDAT